MDYLQNLIDAIEVRSGEKLTDNQKYALKFEAKVFLMSALDDLTSLITQSHNEVKSKFTKSQN